MEKAMKKKSLVNYDAESDVLYIVTHEGVEEAFVEIAPGIHVELDDTGKVIGIEVLRASKVFKPVVKSLYRQMELSKA